MTNTTLAEHACPNPGCLEFRKFGHRNIHNHGSTSLTTGCFYITSRGRRRRFRCSSCGKTFCSTAGTPYYRLKKSRNAFDQVAAMSVEGVSKSTIARTQLLAWNTVARWSDLAAKFAIRFNHRMIRGVQLHELQADEIATFVQNRKNEQWLFATLEVWSRLWVSPRRAFDPSSGRG